MMNTQVTTLDNAILQPQIEYMILFVA